MLPNVLLCLQAATLLTVGDLVTILLSRLKRSHKKGGVEETKLVRNEIIRCKNFNIQTRSYILQCLMQESIINKLNFSKVHNCLLNYQKVKKSNGINPTVTLCKYRTYY